MLQDSSPCNEVIRKGAVRAALVSRLLDRLALDRE